MEVGLGNLDSLIKHVVIQPTTLCNLNCSYCYLPDRKMSKVMQPTVTTAVAKSIERLNHPATIVWHGGEPLACGFSAFTKLMEPLETLFENGKVRHSIQTNATLINDEWCKLFYQKNFKIGISIDGNEKHNSRRVTWGNNHSFHSVMRGITKLKEHKLRFGIIAVVGLGNIGEARELYEFAVSLDCDSLAINIEEKEGLNKNAEPLSVDLVKQFWKDLFTAWKEKPLIRIRELNRVFRWLSFSNEHRIGIFDQNVWPTISTDGDVVVLSPEFASVDINQRNQFVVGNILERPLDEIVIAAFDSWYVRDYIKGIGRCSDTCPYFQFCRGGHASNKFFELHDISGTETLNCVYTKQKLLDAALECLSQ